MKKLLMLLALWSGAASAKPQGTMPTVQDQMDLTATAANKSLDLTPEEHKQAIAQVKENVREIVDACGNDKELLKSTLMQRIEKFEKAVRDNAKSKFNWSSVPVRNLVLPMCLGISFIIATVHGDLFALWLTYIAILVIWNGLRQ